MHKLVQNLALFLAMCPWSFAQLCFIRGDAADGASGRLLVAAVGKWQVFDLAGKLTVSAAWPSEMGSDSPLVAADSGPNGDLSVLGYAACLHQGRLGLWKIGADLTASLLCEVAVKDSKARLGGWAVRNQKGVCTIPARNELIFVDLAGSKVSSRQALPDFPTPRSPVYDSNGRLWMLSANSLAEIQFTPDGHFNPIHHRGDFDSPRALFVTAGRLQVLEGGAAVRLVGLGRNLETCFEAAVSCNPVALTGDSTGRCWGVQIDGDAVVVREMALKAGK